MKFWASWVRESWAVPSVSIRPRTHEVMNPLGTPGWVWNFLSWKTYKMKKSYATDAIRRFFVSGPTDAAGKLNLFCWFCCKDVSVGDPPALRGCWSFPAISDTPSFSLIWFSIFRANSEVFPTTPSFFLVWVGISASNKENLRKSLSFLLVLACFPQANQKITCITLGLFII